MLKKYLFAFMAVALVLVGGIFLMWHKKTRQIPAQNQTNEEAALGTPLRVSESVDTADWQTYRNEEYGFTLQYPATWSAEEFYSAGYGMPVDCSKPQRSQECPYFGVAFSAMSDESARKQPVVFNTFSYKKDSDTKADEAEVEVPTWERRMPTGSTYWKSNSNFPMFGSCFTQAGIPHTRLKAADVGFYFSTFYNVPDDMSMDAAEEFCSQEIPDLIFDKIVESFKSI
ncbi:MAG: hypothetical protein V5B33_08095 [Candidatus Accumulibacter sp. UW20]|jgi:hypothetical protein